MLRRHLEVERETIALIQEPWIRSNNICGLALSDGKIFYHAPHEKPRTGIYCPKTINATLLSQFCYRDQTAIRIQQEQTSSDTNELPPLVLVSLYLPIDEDNLPHAITMELIEFCETNNLDIIIGMDSNAHHTLWGNPTNNKRGEKLLSYLNTTNLTIINKGTEPTFVTSRFQTVIDLTIANLKTADRINNWNVANELTLSDHRYLKFTVELKKQSMQPPVHSITKKLNKKKYIKSLTTNLAQVHLATTHSIEDIETNVTNLTNAITSSYNDTCSSNQRTTHPPQKDWWDKELERKRHKLRHLFNRAKNTRKDEDWDKFKEAQYTYKKTLRRKDNKSWRNFCTNIESESAANRIRKIISKDKNCALGTIKKPDGTYTCSNTETIQTLLQTHFPGCKLADKHIQQQDTTTLKIPTINDIHIVNQIITDDKLKWAIENSKPYKSPGTDKIFPALLQTGYAIIKPWLMDIYKNSLLQGYIPKLWRQVKVVFLPKPGKADYSQPKAFRPISLTSFLLKTLERLCDRYIRDNILVKSPLNVNQHAYNVGKSTETALHQVVSYIEHNLENKTCTLGAFIDIEGAFDKTTFTSINNALHKYNTPTILISWINEMLSKRIIQTETNDSTRGLVSRGCPQGGVLSPLLWNIVVNSLLDELHINDIDAVRYADDITILISGKIENTLEDLMQSALNIAERWCTSNDFRSILQKRKWCFSQRSVKQPLQKCQFYSTKH